MKCAYIYWNKWCCWRKLCWVWKRKQQIIGFPTFKLPESTNAVFMTRYIFFDDFSIWLLGYRICVLKTFNLHQRKFFLVFLCWWIDQTAGVDFDTYCLRVIWPHVISFQLNCKNHGPLCLQTHLQLNVFSREIRLSQKYKIHFEHVENKKTKYIGSCTSCHSLYMFFYETNLGQ